MSTLTKTKKTAVKKAPSYKSVRRVQKFPGLVRDPLTGLLVNPLKLVQKPMSRSVLQKALADVL